jgi:hypothetical protein
MSKKEEVKATETTVVELKAPVAELSSTLQKQFTLDNKTGINSEKDGVSTFNANLPDGLTMELVEGVQKYTKDYTAASRHAHGVMAVAAMAKNSKLDECSIELALGADNVTHTVKRKSEFTIPFGDKKGQVSTKYGATTTTYETRAGKNGGQLKAAGRLIADLAASTLNK